MNVRWLRTKNGEMVLQENTMVGTNQFGHVVFGWVNVEIVDDEGRSIEADAQDEAETDQDNEAATPEAS